MAAVLIGGEIQDLGTLAVAAAGGAVLVFVGFAATSRCRQLSRSATMQPARLALLAVAIGIVLGIVNLAANWLIAEMDPALRTLLVERMAALQPADALVASPILEEIAIRLFLMSVIAWVVSRFVKRPQSVFAIALIASSLFFALPHLARPLPGDPLLSSLYRAALGTKYMLAGLPLGWIFWRWGLPYAILCHVAANAAHLALQNTVF